MEDAAFWDRIARKYAQRPIGNVPAYEATMDRVRSYLAPGHRVLEIGCGTGSTALLLAGGVARYTAIDYSTEMIAIAEEKRRQSGQDNVEFHVAPAVDTLFQPGAFDVVLGFNILHLVPDLPGTLARGHTLLAPGGLFLSKTPCFGLAGWVLRPLIAAMRLFGKAPAVRFRTRQDMEAAFRNAGFDIVEARTFEGANANWFIAARKR